ncbi:MAG TPA: hypothetical protein VGI78_10780 [Acetobacteraceae bacterium]
MLCADKGSKEELQVKLKAYVPMLAQEFPVDAFGTASLAAVGRSFTFFPSFAELCTALSPWWKEHRPQRPAITADQPATIRQREIERQCRESWESVTAEQVRAKIRAIRDSWKPAVYGHFLGIALIKYAPHHLGLLPPEWLRERREPADVVALRRSEDAP